jgi:hypothetical protein
MAQKEVLIKINVDDKSLEQLTGELKGVGAEIKTIETQTAGLNIDQKFMAADGAIKAFAGAVSAAVGAIGLLGVESKVFEEYERYALGAIAFSRGIFDLSEGFQKLKQSTLLATIQTEVFSKVTRKALIATGIGAFVVALGTVVAYWDEITEYVNNLSKKSVKDLNLELETTKDKSNDIITLLESQVSLEFAKGQNTLETNKKLLEQLQLQLDITDEQIKQKQIELAGETDERKRLSFFESLLISLKAFGNARKLALEVDKEVNTETEKEIELQKEINGLLTDRNKIEEKYVGLQKTVAIQQEMAAGGAQKVEVSQRALATTTEGLTTQLQANVGAFDKNAQAQVKNIAAENVAQSNRKLAISQEEARQQGINESAAAISNLSAVLGEESAAAKALAISSAIINTYLGVTEVLKQQSTLPSPFDVITKVANVATILATGFKAVKAIQSTPVGGGGGIVDRGAFPRGIGPATQNPLFNLNTLFNLNALPQGELVSAPRSQERTPIRAYVLAQDVQTETEARDRLNLKRNLT